jgi:hypothetical protein
MDTAILVEELDKSAISLVNELNKKGFDYTVAALMKNDETEDWSIVLGVPGLRKTGSRNSYAEIYQTIKELNLSLSLNEVKLLDDRDVTLLLLKRRFDPIEKISRIVFVGNYINGIRFPDSIIYQIK